MLLYDDSSAAGISLVQCLCLHGLLSCALLSMFACLFSDLSSPCAGQDTMGSCMSSGTLSCLQLSAAAREPTNVREVAEKSSLQIQVGFA